jgi:hypothetical protein
MLMVIQRLTELLMVLTAVEPLPYPPSPLDLVDIGQVGYGWPNLDDKTTRQQGTGIPNVIPRNYGDERVLVIARLPGPRLKEPS